MLSTTTHSKRLARIRRMTERQPSSGWTAQYQPAIRANRSEAPSISRPSVLCDQNVTRREIHVMSLPERAATLVALAHPRLRNLEEQKVLQPLADVHPLFGHPRAVGDMLPPLPGMLWAFQQLGAERRYPILYVRDGERSVAVPEFFVGDLLLTLEDSKGLYCVNWPVKADEKDFGSQILVAGRAVLDKPALRIAAEELNYQAAEIPTHRICRATFDQVLVENVTRLFCWQSQRHCLEGVDLSAFARVARTVLVTPISVPRLREHFIGTYHLTEDRFRIALGILIWDGAVRVDLFKRILLDGYLYPEVESPFDRYASLFSRGIE